MLAPLERRKYLPVMDIKLKKIYIILSEDTCDNDALKAYFTHLFMPLLLVE